MLCYTTDYGPSFYAWSGVISGRTVLVISPQVGTNQTAHRGARALMARQGLSCDGCTKCPLWQMR